MDLVTIAAYPTTAQAHLAKNLLESEGIPAFLADEAMGDMLHLASPAGAAKLQVATEHVEAARRLIDAAERHELAAETAREAEAHAGDPPADAE